MSTRAEVLIESQIQNMRDLAANNLRDARTYKRRGLTGMADWAEGRAAAYRVASESLKSMLDILNEPKDDTVYDYE